MSFITTASATVEYDVHGAGSDDGLLLVHGTGGSAAGNWSHLVGELGRTRTVVLPSYAGSGATHDAGGRLQLDDLVEQVLAAAGAAGLERFDVVGFSLGAVVAVAAAVAEPERVRSVVAIAGWLDSADARAQLQFRLWQELHARDRRLFAGFLALTGFGPGYLAALDARELDALVAELSFTLADGTGRQAELDQRVDLTDVAPRVRVPALVIGCARDHIVPVEQARALHAAIPGASYRELETGHLAIFEEPAALVALIEEFLVSVQ